MVSQEMRSALLPLAMAVAILSAWFLPPSRSEFLTAIIADSPPPTGAPPAGSSRCVFTDPDEQRAVYEVMAATGNGWAATVPDVCREGWHGIECAPDGEGVHHVVSLSFGSLSDDAGFPACDGAGAFLSPALARLTHLRSLFFYRCCTGNPDPIPTFLGELGSRLRTLVLRENGHVGPIPAELRNLTSLRVLDLHGNRLSSSIPPSLAALTRLQVMDLGGNSLTGVIPDLRLPSLKVLDLSNNLLGGQIPPAIGGCGLLIKLDLSGNRLAGGIPESLGGLGDLILLDLSRNRLTGPLPSSMESITSLRALVLSGNQMGAAAAAAISDGAFAGWKSLTTLALSGTGLQGPIPESIGRITSLRVLHLDGNNLSGPVPWSFRGLVHLSELRLDHNQLAGPLPFNKKMLWRMGRKLSVSNNSGLCYDAIAAGEQGAGATNYPPDIAPCAAGTTWTAASTDLPAAAVRSTAVDAAASGAGGVGDRPVRHPVVADSHNQRRSYTSSSAASAHERSSSSSSSALLHWLLLATGILLCASPLPQAP